MTPPRVPPSGPWLARIKGFWIWLTLAVLLLFGGIVAVILTGSLFWKIVGLLILASLISTLRGKGVFSGKKDAVL